MELGLLFVHEKVINKTLIVYHILCQEQIANHFTKPLSQSRFEALQSSLGVVDSFSFINPP